MAETWVIDIRHYLDGVGNLSLPPGPARKLAEYVGSIVHAVTSQAKDSGETVTSVRCRCRPKRKPCQSNLLAGCSPADRALINWQCPACGFSGNVIGWQGTQWDKRNAYPSATQAPVTRTTVGQASIDDVVASVRRIRAMSQAERMLLCDEINDRQPALLGQVLVLSRLGVPMVKIDRVLHILLVLYDLFSRNSPVGLSPVTEETLVQVNTNQLALLQLMDTEERSEARRLCRLSVESHPEINVLAFIMGDLGDAGINDMSKREDEYCVRAARILLDAIVKVNGR